MEFIDGVRRGLAARLPGQTAICAENLDLARFDSPTYRHEMESWLQTKYRGRTLDAIVAVGVHSVAFSIRLRSEMGQNFPIIFSGSRLPTTTAGLRIPRITGVTLKFDVAGTLDAALKLMPDTQRIVLVSNKANYVGAGNRVHFIAERFAQENRLGPPPRPSANNHQATAVQASTGRFYHPRSGQSN